MREPAPTTNAGIGGTRQRRRRILRPRPASAHVPVSDPPIGQTVSPWSNPPALHCCQDQHNTGAVGVAMILRKVTLWQQPVRDRVGGPGTDQRAQWASWCTRSRPDGMAFARRRWRRRQVEAVRTWMAGGQEAVVHISPLLQLRGTRVDLDHLTDLPVPSQPPPLVTAMRSADKRDVTAAVLRDKVTNDATLVSVDVLRDRRSQEVGGTDGGRGAATSLLRARPGEARHLPVTPPECPADAGITPPALLRAHRALVPLGGPGSRKRVTRRAAF